jgi:hypothetical protein
MKSIWRILETMGAITGFVATYLPLYLDYRGVNIWGLSWQIWVMIGFTVFWLTMGVVIWRLSLQVKRLTNKDAELQREREKAQIRHLNLEDGLPGKYGYHNEDK